MATKSQPSRRVFTYRLERLEADSEAYLGRCLACGGEADACEPDARERVCEACGEPQVYGLEELMFMGRINVR